MNKAYVNFNNKWYTKRPDQDMYTWRTWCRLQYIKHNRKCPTMYSNIAVLIYSNGYDEEEGRPILDEKINNYGNAIIRSISGIGLA